MLGNLSGGGVRREKGRRESGERKGKGNEVRERDKGMRREKGRRMGERRKGEGSGVREREKGVR